MKFLKRTLIVLLVMGAAVLSYATHAQESPNTQKLREEFKQVRKEEYLKKLEEREKYYTSMAAEMKAQRKACGGKDDTACEKAKEHTKQVSDELKATRKANSDRFKAKADAYRKKMGKSAPNAPEKKHKELDAAKKKAAGTAPAPAGK